MKKLSNASMYTF